MLSRNRISERAILLVPHFHLLDNIIVDEFLIGVFTVFLDKKIQIFYKMRLAVEQGAEFVESFVQYIPTHCQIDKGEKDGLIGLTFFI